MKPMEIVTFRGYRGDGKTRTILIDKVYNNRVVGLCGARNEYRSYLLEFMGDVRHDNRSTVDRDVGQVPVGLSGDRD